MIKGGPIYNKFTIKFSCFFYHPLDSLIAHDAFCTDASEKTGRGYLRVKQQNPDNLNDGKQQQQEQQHGKSTPIADDPSAKQTSLQQVIMSQINDEFRRSGLKQQQLQQQQDPSCDENTLNSLKRLKG